VTLLALKLLLGPALVIGASLAARRFGPRLGGVVAGLPAITAPILIVVAIDHGLSFAVDAATAALLGMVGLLAFVLTYAWVSHRVSWMAALGAGWAASSIVTAGLDQVHVGPYTAVLIVSVASVLTLALLPRARPGAPSGGTQQRWDLALRGGCTLIPILAVTGTASLLGSHLSGLLAGFPVIAPILAAFTHAQHGAAEAIRLLHGLTIGFVAYGVFCLVVSISLRELGIAASFALATVLTLVAQGIVLVLTRARDRELLAEAVG
jgi:flagellar biogenesis protein FliO